MTRGVSIVNARPRSNSMRYDARSRPPWNRVCRCDLQGARAPSSTCARVIHPRWAGGRRAASTFYSHLLAIACPLFALGLPVHVVHGNNAGDPAALHALESSSSRLIAYHGPDADLRLGGRRLFATHYPHYGRALACTGEYDVVCCGHSHAVGVARQKNIQGGHTWLVNPGTVAGLGAPASWILGDLATLAFEIRRVSMEWDTPAIAQEA